MQEQVKIRPLKKDDKKEADAQRQPRETPPSRRRVHWVIMSVFLLMALRCTAMRRELQSEPRLPSHNDHHHSQECSCQSPTAPPECCQRMILRSHKFGWILATKLFRSIDLQALHPETLANDTDYRHVAITRNLYDAAVSGYLYHKSGRECWLKPNGKPLPTGKHRTIEWDKEISHLDPLFPPRNGRSICTYLREESEEDGMRVYIDVVLTKMRWCGGVVPYWEAVQQRLQEDPRKRTKFVCYEDLTDPTKVEPLFVEIMDWLFPSGHNYTLPPDAKQPYSGGHATSHNEALRSRLVALVKKLDENVFHEKLGAMQAIFKCGE